MSEPQAELKTLLNIPTEVTVGGKALALSPLKFGELSKALDLAGPLLAELGNPDNRWIDLVLHHAERLVPLTAHLSRQPIDWVAALELDDAADLLGSCVAVNADFFARRVSPALLRMMGGLTGANPKNPAPKPAVDSGPTSSGS